MFILRFDVCLPEGSIYGRLYTQAGKHGYEDIIVCVLDNLCKCEQPPFLHRICQGKDQPECGL